MYKKSHRALGAALTPLLVLPTTYVPTYKLDNYLISLGFLIFYFIGTTFPDLDMKFKVFFKNQNERYRYHRQVTHSILLVGLLLYGSLIYLPTYTTLYMLSVGFSLGIIAHLLGDVITGSVPWLLYAPYYRRFQRIGITVFLPKIVHPLFTERLPKYFDKNMWIFVVLFLINVIVVLQLNIHGLFNLKSI